MLATVCSWPKFAVELGCGKRFDDGLALAKQRRTKLGLNFGQLRVALEQQLLCAQQATLPQRYFARNAIQKYAEGREQLGHVIAEVVQSIRYALRCKEQAVLLRNQPAGSSNGSSCSCDLLFGRHIVSLPECRPSRLASVGRIATSSQTAHSFAVRRSRRATAVVSIADPGWPGRLGRGRPIGGVRIHDSGAQRTALHRVFTLRASQMRRNAAAVIQARIETPQRSNHAE